MIMMMSMMVHDDDGDGDGGANDDDDVLISNVELAVDWCVLGITYWRFWPVRIFIRLYIHAHLPLRIMLSICPREFLHRLAMGRFRGFAV